MKIKCWISVLFFLPVAVLSSPWVVAQLFSRPLMASDAKIFFSVLSSVSALCVCFSFLVYHHKWGRWSSRVNYICFLWIVVELILAISVKQLWGYWHFGLNVPDDRFSFHPALVGLPTPGFKYSLNDRRTGLIHFKHNEEGFRGEPFKQQKTPGKSRLLVIGGSTTYDPGVSNDEMWTKKLQDKFKDSEVYNLGVMGTTSAEHVVLTALKASDYQPDVILFYMGWNDIRNSHLKNLRSDYSDFHYLTQYQNLGIEKKSSPSAIVYVLSILFRHVGLIEPQKNDLASRAGEKSKHVDQRLAAIYRRNIRSLAALTRALKARPVFIPQVINKHRFKATHPYGWIPLVDDRDVPPIMNAFNQILIETCGEIHAEVVQGINFDDWADDDFVDNGHFSGKGTEKFSTIVAKELERLQVVGGQ